MRALPRKKRWSVARTVDAPARRSAEHELYEESRKSSPLAASFGTDHCQHETLVVGDLEDASGNPASAVRSANHSAPSWSYVDENPRALGEGGTAPKGRYPGGDRFDPCRSRVLETAGLTPIS
jgi:hypothetical protein